MSRYTTSPNVHCPHRRHLGVAVAPRSEAAISCGTVVLYLNPCLPYVTNKGSLGSCCSGVKGLYGAAKTTPDRQSVCSCLKSLAGSYKDVDLSKAAGLPTMWRQYSLQISLPLIAQR
ncbi:Non-specific lipid-transfer protein 2 [Sesamum angolense]|uniref:Non-specific lipid-transfer protein n=1 Tax=Sesamum angolense TaxID=2727404 RepID=A0AAE1X7I9_9LAMI|nr:Non-specific lipid-transfer protein 2 [Sesamum angolense]